jgi:hypothetical protein
MTYTNYMPKPKKKKRKKEKRRKEKIFFLIALVPNINNSMPRTGPKTRIGEHGSKPWKMGP